MTLEQINNLTLDSDFDSQITYREYVQELLRSQAVSEMESPTQEDIDASYEIQFTEEELSTKFEEIRADLIAKENERLRIQDLKDRFSALSDVRLACATLSISNPDAYFRDYILKQSDKGAAEANMAALEAADQEEANKMALTEYARNRAEEYSKIDKMLLEAIAEKEAGDSTKMGEYLQLRAAIKAQYPKP